jgi:hypothetical protein
MEERGFFSLAILHSKPPVGASSRIESGTGQPRMTEIKKRQGKEKGCYLILLFLDEKKQKSSDYIIC